MENFNVGLGEHLTKETTMATSSHPKFRLTSLVTNLAITNRPATRIVTSEVMYSFHP
jgi:hypothetical protein